ncbi:MAG TPA: hydroxyacid dehydrogenase [Clostridia bacterium]|nr:hydroxyacid dehydrogenase [Clostridia bacterium]
MAYKVLIPEVVAEDGIRYLKELGYEVKRGRGTDKMLLLEDICDCDAVIVRVAVIDREIMEKSPRLKVIAKHGAGYDNIDTRAAAERRIRVVYAPTANSHSVAEHTMALILACAKQIPFMAREYQKGDPGVKDRHLNREIQGKCLGLIGLGRIGTSVAKMATRGFDMDVVAYDPYLPKDRVPHGVRLVDNREVLLSQADYVSIHVPATPENVKSMSSREFKLMKSDAVLINAARGQIVDEEALFCAIRDGEIAGAGLDVNDPEPARPENPLFQLDGVILTPHCAGSTKEAMVRMVMDAATGIHEVLTGKEPTYKVV